MKKLFKKIILLIPILLVSNQLQANAGKAISTVGAGATLYASGAAIYNGVVSDKAKACCNGADGGTCCVLSVVSAASALNMLVAAGESSDLSNVASCSDSGGSGLCNSYFTVPDVSQIETIQYDTSTGLDTTTADSNSESSRAPSNYAPGFSFENYSDYANKVSTANNALKARVQGVLDSLEAKGVSLSADGKTVTLPDGSTVSTSALSTPGGLAESGFSDSSIAAANAAIKAANKTNVNDELKRLMGTAGAYAGGGGRRAGTKGERVARANGPDMNALLNGLMNKNKASAKRGPTSFEGVSKSLSNGEKIGVAADNLFEMVHRKYQKKQNTFAP